MIMKKILLFTLLFISGCAGTGLEKRATLVPDSITLGYGSERYHGEPDAWIGYNISATWEFK
jgi:hypothetical protein